MKINSIEKRRITGSQYEPLPQLGWRCGLHGTHPEFDRHAKNAEFVRAKQSARRHRQSTGIGAATVMILGLLRLREMRGEIQIAYAAAVHQRALANAATRAAGHRMGEITAMGRDVGAVLLTRADHAASYADQLSAGYDKLSAAYETERARLLKKVHAT